MADRSLVYRLKADITHYAAGMRMARGIMADFGDQATKADRDSAKFRRGLDHFGGVAGKIGLVAGAGLAAAVTAAARFDAGMSKVSAATHETAANMDRLRDAALKAGADTVFSATESAQAIEELAKAGVSTADILNGGLNGALNLAAAGSLDVGQAAEIAATALNQFKLGGDQMNHVSDLLSAAAGKAQGSVSDLAYALKYAGVPAQALGVSIEETTAVLGEFASAGIIGEQAGTTLRGILISLATATGPAQKAMDSAGITFYDASGKFIGLSAAADELHTKLSGLSEAQRNNTLVKIFGRESLQGAITLYQGGSKAVDTWTRKVNDAGYAADTAARNMDNLSGDVEKFTGALETALIKSGEGAQAPLRTLTQAATGAVDAFGGLPSAAQGVATSFLAITAVTGGAAWFGSKVIQGVSNTRAALDDLGASGSKLPKTFSVATKTLAGLTAGIIAYQAAADALNFGASSDDIRRKTELIEAGAGSDIQAQIEALTAAEKRLRAKAESGADVNLGFTHVYLDQSNADTADEADGLLKRIAELKHQQEVQAAAAQAAANTQDNYAGATSRASSATKKNTWATDDNVRSLKDQVKAMKDARDQRLAALNAEIDYQQSIRDAEAAIKENGRTTADNGKTLDITTEKGANNARALNEVAAGWNNLSQKMKNAPGAFAEAKRNFIDLAEQMGLNHDAAKDLAHQILQLPSKTIKLKVEKEQAEQRLLGVKHLIDSLHDKHITIRATTLGYHVQKDGHLGGTLTAYATGGYVRGAGGPTSDSILARLSNGEYVINAKATARHRQLLEQINANRYASGGYVGASAAFPSTMNLSPRDIAALAQAIGGPRQVYGDAHFYGDGAAEREARKRQQMGGF